MYMHVCITESNISDDPYLKHYSESILSYLVTSHIKCDVASITY